MPKNNILFVTNNFTLPDVTIRFWGDISDLSWTCNSRFERKCVITYWAKYSGTGSAIQLHHWWCRYTIRYHINIRQWKIVSHCNNDDVGRWQKKVPQNCNTINKAQLPTGLIIFKPVAVKIRNAWIVKSCLEQGIRSIVPTIWHACEEINLIYSSCNKCWPCGLTWQNCLTITTSTCYIE